MRGTIPGENYANLNVCYFGIGSTTLFDFNVWWRLEMTHCNFGKCCILRSIKTVIY